MNQVAGTCAPGSLCFAWVQITNSCFAQVKAVTGGPPFHHSDIFGLILLAGYGNFRGSFIVWAVEGNSNYRMPTKSLSDSLPNAVSRSFLFKVQHRVKAVPVSLVVQ